MSAMQLWCGSLSYVYVTFSKDTNIANANQPIAAAVNTVTAQKPSRSATGKPWLIADVYGGPNPSNGQVRRRPSSPGGDGSTRRRTTAEQHSVRILSVGGLSVGMFVGGAPPTSRQREAWQSPTTQIVYVWISHLHRGPQLHGPVLFCSSSSDQAPRLL
jgi:hypothetical protein